MSKRTFNPADYIVTKEGHRGYVVERLDYCVNAYQIRLASGLTIRSGEDLELDMAMMYDDYSMLPTELA